MDAEHITWAPRNGITFSFIPENVLTRAEVELYGQNYWLLPSNKSGHIEFDFGCTKKLNTIELVNTRSGSARNRGTKVFTVEVRSSVDEPWQTLMNKTKLRDLRNHWDPLPLEIHHFKSASTRFVRFNVIDFYGKGGGLQYLNYLMKGRFYTMINDYIKIFGIIVRLST